MTRSAYDYSTTTLITKLGFKAGDSVFVVNTPDWYSGFAADNDWGLSPDLPATHTHIFCFAESDLQSFLDEYILADITEQTLCDHTLPLGWVDTKVATIGDTWSGLKFLRRKN